MRLVYHLPRILYNSSHTDMGATTIIFRKHAILFLSIAIFTANILIRLPNLSFPNYPVFDEVHFATYATAYANREAHLDIHPPLGKMLYSLPLLFSPRAGYERTSYIDYDFAGKGVSVPPSPYGTFPYFALRLFSAFFGGLLAVAVFLFTKELAKSVAPALIAAAFLTLENSIILETKLILLNGFFLAFGFLGLYLLLKNKGAWAGFSLGLAVSVKLLAGIFGIIGVVLASIFKKNEFKKSVSFVLIAIATFFAFAVVVDNIWVPTREKGELLEKAVFKPLRENPEWQAAVSKNPDTSYISALPKNVTEFITVAGTQALFSFGGYTVFGEGPPAAESAWYTWPLMAGSFAYYFEFGDATRPALVLMGNPIVWGFSTGGIVIGVKKLLEKKRRAKKSGRAEAKGAVEFLVFSYFAYLALFLLLVRRDAFLYHYFPALILGIVLFSLLFWEFVREKSPRARRLWYSGAAFLAILGFISAAPFTYGLF